MDNMKIMSLRPGLKIRAKIKQIPEDFIVEEISKAGQVISFDNISEDNFDSDVTKHDKGGNACYAMFRKKDYDMFKAIGTVSKSLGISQNNISFAGTKDKRAVTTQLISVSGTTKTKINGFKAKDIDLRYVGSGSKMHLGDLYGNRFIITLRDISSSFEDLQDMFDNKDTFVFPNYFGPQRFGDSRPITHIIGRHILKGDYKSAVLDYVSKTFDSDKPENAAIRKLSADDPKKALESGKVKSYERMLLQHISDNPGDYKGAIERFPLQLRRMFVHAYQSYLFNRVLDILLIQNFRDYKLEIPYFGYLMKLPKNPIVLDALRQIFSEEKLNLSDFRVDGMEILASKGGYRNAFGSAHDFSVIDISEDELNQGRNKITVTFTLPKGSYATVFLKEFIDI